MPDLLDDEVTRKLFRELRAAELAQVTPPGTASARHTVRRRRLATTSLAAGVALVALAGGMIALGQSASPQANPAPASTRSQEDLDRLADQARHALRLDDIATAPSFFAAGSAPMATTSQNLEQDQEGRYVFQDVDQGDGGKGVSPARYQLAYACRGSGSAKLTWSIGATTRTATLTCGSSNPATPLKADGTLILTSAGVMTVRIEPDGEAFNRAAYAYLITRS